MHRRLPLGLGKPWRGGPSYQVVAGLIQRVPCLSIALRTTKSLRMHAVSATFFGFPAATRSRGYIEPGLRDVYAHINIHPRLLAITRDPPAPPSRPGLAYAALAPRQPFGLYGKTDAATRTLGRSLMTKGATAYRVHSGGYPPQLTYKLPIGPSGDHRGMKIAGLFLAVQRRVRGQRSVTPWCCEPAYKLDPVPTGTTDCRTLRGEARTLDSSSVWAPPSAAANL